MYNNILKNKKGDKMSPTYGLIIVTVFLTTLLSLGLAILLKTINEGKSHKAN